MPVLLYRRVDIICGFEQSSKLRVQSDEHGAINRSCKMNWRPLISLALGCLMLTSCATPALWKHTNPHEYVVIKRTPEAQARIERSGLDYRMDEERGLIFVEKSKLRKLQDYTIRFFGTPIAIAADASAVGAVIFVISQAGGEHVEEDRTQEQREEVDRLEKILKEYGDSEDK